MPTVLRFRRYRFFFFSNEGTEPPHIHVEAGDDHAKFWLDPVALARSIGFNSTEVNRLKRFVTENRDRLLVKWNEHLNR